MNDRIELAELSFDCRGGRLQLVRGRPREVEWEDRRFRSAGGDDRVVESFELADDATVQRNRRTLRGDRVCQRLAESAGRPRDEDDLACECAQLSDFEVDRCRSLIDQPDDQGSFSTTFAVAVPPLPSLIV